MLYDIRFGLFWLCRVFVLQNLTEWLSDWLSDYPTPRDPSDLKTYGISIRTHLKTAPKLWMLKSSCDLYQHMYIKNNNPKQSDFKSTLFSIYSKRSMWRPEYQWSKIGLNLRKMWPLWRTRYVCIIIDSLLMLCYLFFFSSIFYFRIIITNFELYFLTKRELKFFNLTIIYCYFNL